jgi:regulatory protein
MQDKKQKSITTKRLENIALYYLSKYDSSAENLKAVLKRRVEKARLKGADVPENASEAIEEITDKMVRLGYIDDSRFKENLLRRLGQAGKSRAQIMQKMIKAGVRDDEALADYDEDEAAAVFVKKKRLGINPENYMKDLAKLARAGFSKNAAKKALQS